MSQGSSGKKVSNSIVALSSAAILAVYSAGYSKTRPAAQKLAAQVMERRLPVAAPIASPIAPPQPDSTPAEATPVKREAPVQARAAVAAPVAPPKAEAPDPPPAPVAEAPPVAAPEPAPTVVEPKVGAAPPPPPPPPAPAPPPAPKWKDGTFTGWGTSRHGDIEAAVVIEGGQIKEAKIAQCLTRYSCDVISELPLQVSKRQSPEVDFVSGATQSANAFYYAVVEALGKAK